MFTKRHYENVAETIRQTKAGFGEYQPGDAMITNAVNGVREVIARDLADMFADDNPRFDRDKFLNACEVR